MRGQFRLYFLHRFGLKHATGNTIRKLWRRRGIRRGSCEELLEASGCGGCIPECFVGHYRVKQDPGLHCPVNSWDALTTAPFRSVPPHSAEKTWLRFFIAVRISSRDSVCFRPYFWSD